MSAQPVDVLAVMDDCAGSLSKLGSAGMVRASELREARAAVAELVEAANEHPDVEQLPAIAAIARKILNSEQLQGHEKEFAASMLQTLCRVTRASRAALARVQGGQS